MTKHPTKDWEWEETAEVALEKWINGKYTPSSYRFEYFYRDCEEPDENQRKQIMFKWLHSAFLTGYNTGRCSKTNED
jgi:hypothetical protein